MILTIITSVIGALCVAAILALFKSRWLYVIAPKMYLNTPISDGQIVTLTIVNAGLLAEEDVAITLIPACKFELIATSKSTLVSSGRTLSIPKLSKSESITILLLIEGKTFDQTDIESIESKSTKGKVVESKEKATAPWQSMVAIPLILLFLGAPFVFGTVVGAEMRISIFQYINNKLELTGQSKQLAGYKSTLRKVYGFGKLEKDLKDSRLSIQVIEVVRRKDILTIIIGLANNTNEPLMTDGSVKSSAGESGPLDFRDSRVETFALAPGEKKSVKLKVFLPESISAKIVDCQFSFESTSGGSLKISQLLEFN